MADDPELIDVRSDERLDLTRLEPYLRARLAGAEGPLELRQFGGGHANLTYLLRFGEMEYVLRRPPLGPVAPSSHDMAREHRVLAALSRVFPFIFGVPLVARMAWDAWQERRVSRETRSFVNGAVGTLGVTVLLAWMMVGTSGFVTGAENLVKHNGAEAYSSQKVGLGDALFYRGETTRLEMRKQPCGGFERLIGSDCEEHGNIYGKSKLLKLIEPQLKLVGVGAIILVCLFAIRSRRPLHQLPPLAVLPLFCLTNPSYYYYILRIVLVLFHAENLSRRSNVVGLCLLFAMEISAHATKLAGYERYTTTATTSWWLIVYFVVVGTLMVREMLDDEAQPENE